MAGFKTFPDNFVPQEVWDEVCKDMVITSNKKYKPFAKPLSESTRLVKKPIAYLINHCCSICGTHMDTLCEHLRYTPPTANEYVKHDIPVITVDIPNLSAGPANHIVGDKCMVCGVSVDTPCIHLTGKPQLPRCAASKSPDDILIGFWPIKKDPNENITVIMSSDKTKSQQATNVAGYEPIFMNKADFYKMKLSEVGPEHQPTWMTKATGFPEKVSNGHPDCHYCLNERSHFDDACYRLRGHPGIQGLQKIVTSHYDISYVTDPAEPSTQGVSGTNGLGYYSGIHGVSGPQPQNKYDYTPKVGSPCPYCAKGRYHAGEYCQDAGKVLGTSWTPCKNCKDDPFHLDGICGATGIPGPTGPTFYEAEDGVSGAQGPIGPKGPTFTDEDGCQGVMGPCGGPTGPCNMECPSINCESYCDHFKSIGNECPRGPEGTPGPAGIPAPCPIHGDKSKMPHGLCLCDVGGTASEGKLDVCKICDKVIIKGSVCCGFINEPWIQRIPTITDKDYAVCSVCIGVYKKGTQCKHFNLLEGEPGVPGLPGCGGHELGRQGRSRFDTPGRKWLPPAKKRVMCGTSLVMAGPNALAHRQERRESTHPPLKKETTDFIHPRTAAYVKAHPIILVDDMEEPP